MGGYIWFVGLGGGLLLLAIAYFVADMRKRKTAPPNSNHAWEQAAAETGHPEVARPDKP